MTQSLTYHHRDPSRSAWPARILGAVIALLGLVLAGGGALLASRGGSWYYLLAGVGLVAAGVLLTRHRSLGAWCYGGVLAATVAWTAWESGLDYWGWVPRVGLLLGLAILVALLLPRLDAATPRRVAVSLAGAFALVLVAAFGLSFAVGGMQAGPVAAMTAGPVAVPPADAGTTDWPTVGGSADATRYSPSRQIDKANVGQLQRAWTYRTGDLPETRWGAETTPLKVGDTVYLCSARNILIALDAGTGAERWRFDPKVSDKAIPYTAACRGVAHHVVPGATGECAARVIEGTLDGRLVAVDAATGRPCSGFGNKGEVDIKLGMGDSPPGYVSITSAPTIVRGVVITGHQVLDGQKRDAPSGVILGYDVVTGALRWAWDVVRPDRTGLPPAGEAFTRGTPNMWTTATGDEALGHVYLPMGNPAADYWSSLRRPEELAVSSALVALDVSTGKPVWIFQTVHADVWDYDLGSQGTLIDFPTAAGKRPAIVLASKQGDIYVLDRRDGKPLMQVVERPAPGGGLEPQMRSKTQPSSTYHTLRRPDLTEHDMWGITPIDQLVCRIQFRSASYQGIYTPPTADTPFVEYPGYNGGSDWGGIAIDPTRSLIIANYNDMPNYSRLVPRAEAQKQGWLPRGEGPDPEQKGDEAGDAQEGTPYAIQVNAGWRVPLTGMLCKQPPYGGIRAIDLASGKTVWDGPLGTARANGPFGIPSKLPVSIGTPNNGGAVVTAGGLVFIAAATDNLIRAIDIDTGKTLWTDVLPAGGQATPMVYEQGGREYLVIVAAGHHFMMTPKGDYVIAYALPPLKALRTAQR